jgi:ferredoxin--NADP+ reductase
MSSELNATVVQRIEVSMGLIVLRVVPDGWDLPEFSAGQFAVLGLTDSAARAPVVDQIHSDAAAPASGKLIKRAYSIASSSVANEYIEFFIVLVPSGELTPRLFSLREGDKLWLGKKISGLFTLDEVPKEKHVILLGTGTGLAPYVSMLRTHLECGTPRRFSVVHGARHSWELGYRSELLMLSRMCSNFTYIPTISRPEEEPVPWGGQTGYIQDVWNSDVISERWGFTPTPDDTHLFLCGNPNMVETMVDILGEQNFVEHKKRSPGQVHVERFW